MRWSTAGIARIAHIAKYGPGLNALAGIHIRKPVKMRIVMSLPARTQNPYSLSAQAIDADPGHDAFCRCAHSRAARRENINPFMSPPAATVGMPCIAQSANPDIINRDPEMGWRAQRRQSDQIQRRLNKRASKSDQRIQESREKE
jgi:hypothetical protein